MLPEFVEFDRLSRDHFDLLSLFVNARTSMTNARAAHRLRIPLGTVKSRLNRAHEKLAYLRRGDRP